jgi:hypothetical protein
LPLLPFGIVNQSYQFAKAAVQAALGCLECVSTFQPLDICGGFLVRTQISLLFSTISFLKDEGIPCV